MGNYKDMFGAIASFIERGKPFLLIKYGVEFCYVSNNMYEIVTIEGGQATLLADR